MHPYEIWLGSLPKSLSLIPREDLCEDFPVWFVGADAQFSIWLTDKDYSFTDERFGKIILNIKVYKGDLTDLASVPKFSLIQPVRFPRPALLHDIGYRYTIDEMVKSGRMEIIRDGAKIPVEDVEKQNFFLYMKQDGYKRQKLLFDQALRYFCQKDCKSLSASAPARIYYAVKCFGGSSFLNRKNRDTITHLVQKAKTMARDDDSTKTYDDFSFLNPQEAE